MTTNPPPLRAAPLQIEQHQFLDVECHASENEQAHADLALQTRRVLAPHMEDPCKFRLELVVGFGGERDGKPSMYSGSLRIVGFFQVHEKFPPEKRRALIEITGASILYGACREMLCLLTARGPHGMVSLPSVTFQPIAPPAPVPESKTTARKPPKEKNKQPVGKTGKKQGR